MKTLIASFLVATTTFFFIPNVHAELDKTTLNNACMSYVVAGLVKNGTLGGNSGVCLRLKKDETGNINAIDFGFTSSSFKSGKDQLPQNAESIKKLSDFILSYQKEATGNPNLKLNDLNMEFKSFADGERGPQSYDETIKSEIKSWKDIESKLGSDQKTLNSLRELIRPKNADTPIDFSKSNIKVQSLIRNLYLAQARSRAICNATGKDCSKDKLLGFASPELEKNGNKKCDARRLSMMKVDLAPNGSFKKMETSTFHPGFETPSNQLKSQMQLAANMDLFRKAMLYEPKKSDDSEFKAERKEFYKFVKELGFYQDQKETEFLSSLIRRTPQQLQSSACKKKQCDPAQIIEKAKTLFDKQFQFQVEEMSEKAKSSGEFPPLAMDKTCYDDTQRLRHNINSSNLNMINLTLKELKQAYNKVDSATKKLIMQGDYDQLAKSLYKNCNDTKTTDCIKEQKKLVEKLKPFMQGPKQLTDTDMLNCFSADKALSYNLSTNDNSPYLQGANGLVNSSNAEIKIRLDSKDIHQVHGAGGWAAQGWVCKQCGSGVRLNSNGSISYQARSDISKQAAQQVVKNGTEDNLSFGNLKNLKVWIIPECSSGTSDPCHCMKTGGNINDVLSSKGKSIPIQDLSNQDKTGNRFFETSSKIEQPESTCLFTPPVPHTCRVNPAGESEEQDKHANENNASCVVLNKDFKAETLKLTAESVNDVFTAIGKFTNPICSGTPETIEEIAASAECKQTFPDEQSEKEACPD